MRRLPLIIAAAAVALINAAPASAQSTEPLKIIFPYAAGGSGDGLARLMAEHLRISLNQPVIVENRTGAQGRIGVQAVKSAAPDGNTMLLTPIAPVSIYQLVYKSLGYDPVKDLAPVAQVATFDFALAVGPQVPSKSLKELVEHSRLHHPTQGLRPHLHTSNRLSRFIPKKAAGTVMDMAANEAMLISRFTRSTRFRW